MLTTDATESGSPAASFSGLVHEHASSSRHGNVLNAAAKCVFRFSR